MRLACALYEVAHDAVPAAPRAEQTAEGRQDEDEEDPQEAALPPSPQDRQVLPHGSEIRDAGWLGPELREGRDDVFRYRIRFTETFKPKLTPLRLNPYLREEFFLDEGETSPSEASRLRFVAGLKGDPEHQFRFFGIEPREGRQFNMDMYVLYDYQEDGDDWVNTFVFGLKLGVFF